MNWDEKAKQNAIWCGYNSLTLGVAEAKGIQTVYTHAAQWQRDQLRTPEAIERAADILSFQTTGGCYPKADEQCRHVMKEVFDALLGED